MTTLVPNHRNENRKRGPAQFSYRYLTIVPRGLQSEIASGLRGKADALVALDDAVGDDGGGTIDDENARLRVTIWNKEEDGETMREALRDFSSHQKEKQQRQQERQRQNRQRQQPNGAVDVNININTNININIDHLNKTQLEEHVSAAWLPPGSFVGSVKLSSSGQHVSIGYSRPTSFSLPSASACDAPARDTQPRTAPSWTRTGQMAGSVWMQLETNHEGISRDVIASSRSIGPLLALITVQTDNRCLEGTTTATTTTNNNNNNNNPNDADAADQANETNRQSPRDHDDYHYYQRYHKHSLEEMTEELARHLRSDPSAFSRRRDEAIRLWKDRVAFSPEWRDRLSPRDREGLEKRVRENELRFRLSCVRVEPFAAPSPSSRKRKPKFGASSSAATTDRFGFAYDRKEFCGAVMDACGRDLVPEFRPPDDGDNPNEKPPARSGRDGGRWTVDLTDFDLEFVVFLFPPNPRRRSGSNGTCTGKLAIGISLRPYSFLRSKSFETGQLPPDVTVPYLGGGILSQDVLRLRPTTAHLLLEMADLQPGDLVLDPCAGIGTIPVEAERYYQSQCQSPFQYQRRGGPGGGKDRYLAIGGDLVLNNPKFARIAGLLETMGSSGVDDSNCDNNSSNNNSSNSSSRSSSSMLVAWDAAHLPLRTSSVDVAVSDLPFGQQCMSINSLRQLLPLIFLECARVLRPRTGRMVALAGGSPIALIACIEKLSGDFWEKPLPRVSPVTIGGILAWIVVAVRNDRAWDRGGVPERRALVRKIAAKRDRTNRQRKSDSCEQQTGGRTRRKGNAPAGGLESW